jgi:hypothetical protein
VRGEFFINQQALELKNFHSHLSFFGALVRGIGGGIEGVVFLFSPLLGLSFSSFSVLSVSRISCVSQRWALSSKAPPDVFSSKDAVRVRLGPLQSDRALSPMPRGSFVDLHFFFVKLLVAHRFRIVAMRPRPA